MLGRAIDPEDLGGPVGHIIKDNHGDAIAGLAMFSGESCPCGWATRNDSDT
jgi:hypothetical protein